MRLARVAVLGLSVVWSNAALAGAAEGIWRSQDGDLKIRLSDCGGKLCGRVVWLSEPIDAKTGRPKTDKHNPDPAKRTRPLIGLKVVQGMRPSGPNQWSGFIYNADDGHTYRGHLELRGSSTARVEGCVLKVLCKGHIWTRAN